MLKWYEKIGQIGGPNFTVRVTEFDVDNIGPHDSELYADFLRDTHCSLFVTSSGRISDVVSTILNATLLLQRVEAICVVSLRRGFTDDCHWKDSAPSYGHDWVPKPGLAVWEKLVLKEWRSTSAGNTAASGVWTSPPMHKGSYNISVDCPSSAAPVFKLASLTGKLTDVSVKLPKL